MLFGKKSVCRWRLAGFEDTVSGFDIENLYTSGGVRVFYHPQEPCIGIVDPKRIFTRIIRFLEVVKIPPFFSLARSFFLSLSLFLIRMIRSAY